MIRYILLLLLLNLSCSANDFDASVIKVVDDVERHVDNLKDKTNYIQQVDDAFNETFDEVLSEQSNEKNDEKSNSNAAVQSATLPLEQETIFSLTDDEPKSVESTMQSSFNKNNINDELNFEADMLRNFYDKVVILVTNKITAKSQSLTIKIGSSAFFGNIEIFPLKCWRSPNRYNPESKVFLNIIEHKIHDDSINIFAGWMFSSSIALSTVEHPIYEVSVNSCTGEKLPNSDLINQ